MLYDTTWNESRIYPKYGAQYCFSEWFNSYFVGSLEPSASGGFESVESSHPLTWAVTSCRECGALVLHDGTRYEEFVVHLNAHRSWHDQINHVLSEIDALGRG